MKSFSSSYRIMLAVLAITAFAPTLKTGFMWDDHVMIEENPALRAWNFQNLKHDFTHDVFDHHGDAYYRPAQTLANRVDYTLWGLHPLGFHFTNLLFHIGNTLLVAELILALGCLPLTGLIAGTLFAVHPIVVEQLMIIAGRAELMGLFFSLATLLLLLKDSKRALVLGGLAYGMALLSKESALILPALLGLVYYTRHEPAQKYRRLLPMILILAPYLYLRHVIVGPIVTHPDGWLTIRFFFQEFPSVIVRYLALLIFPWNLHSHRLLPHLSHAWLLYLLGVTGLCVYGIKRFGRMAVFCIGWFLLVLLPKTPVMIYGNFMLDHWAYPAAIAVILPLALAITYGWNARKNSTRSLAALIYFPTLIVWALLVHLNVALRGTDEKMYRWALHFTASNPIKFNLGALLLNSGRAQESIEYLEDVYAHYPEDSETARALALAYWTTGQRSLAIHILENYAQHYPNRPVINRTLHLFRATH